MALRSITGTAQTFPASFTASNKSVVRDMLASENHIAEEWSLVAVRDEGEGRDGLRDD